MNSKIIPVQAFDAANLHYNAGSYTVRVFDTNGAGHLIPVEFQRSGLGFDLMFVPHGQIYAEVSI